jgi:hypothetical protein
MPMTTASPTLRPAPEGLLDSPADQPEGEPPPSSRRQARRAKKDRARTRLGLAAALLICAGVPTGILISLWSNLTLPFWYNEQWRAYYISNQGNWWQALKTDGAPFPAGWYFLERLSGSIFGSTELALRIPTAIFLPITCVLLLLLARRWLPLGAAVVVALVGSLTGTLVSYAVQLSEYQIDAAAVVGVLLLHELIEDIERPTWRTWRLYAMYAGIAVACVFSTPAVFVAGPLLLFDAVRELWRRNLGPRLLASVLAGVLALVHLVAFVLPQSALTKEPYWDAQFLPHDGFGKQVSFVWDGLNGFVTGAFTSSQQNGLPGGLVASRWSWVASVAFGVLLLLGIVAVARSRRGRQMLLALGGSLLLTLVASYYRHWPFGFVRTNFWLIPPLILLAGVGAHRSIRWCWATIRRTGPGWIAARRAAGGAVGVALVALLVGGLVVVSLYEVGGYRQIRAATTAPAYGARIGDAVATVRSHARPGAAVVVSGLMAIDGWEYYQYEYAGKATDTGRQIGTSHADFVVHAGSSSIHRTMERVNPPQVFIYIPFGTSGKELQADVAQVTKGRLCTQTGSAGFGSSGLLITLSCSKP